MLPHKTCYLHQGACPCDDRAFQGPLKVLTARGSEHPGTSPSVHEISDKLKNIYL